MPVHGTLRRLPRRRYARLVHLVLSMLRAMIGIVFLDLADGRLEFADLAAAAGGGSEDSG